MRVVQGRCDEEESDAPSTKLGLVEVAKTAVKKGCFEAALVLRDGILGAALFVAMFREQIVEAADRWDDLADDGLGKAIPITLVLGFILLVRVSAYICRKMVGRLGLRRRWWSSPTYRD